VADAVGRFCTGVAGAATWAARSLADGFPALADAADTGTADLARGVAASVDRLAAVGARLPAPSFTLWRGPAERDVAAGDRGVDVAAAPAAEFPEARAEEAAAVEAVSLTPSSAWAVPAPASASPTPRAPAPNHA
jgi:hypothetical protein